MNAPKKYTVFRAFSRFYEGLQLTADTGLRVLLYHSVGTGLPDDPHGTGIDAALFKEHLDQLVSMKAAYAFSPFRAPQRGLLALAVTFDDGYKDVLTTAAPLLAARGIPFTLFASVDHVRKGSPLYLNEAELKALSRVPGVAIGSHAVTHRPLTSLSDQELSQELSSSKKYLEDLLGRSVEAVSYPYGAVDRRVRDAAKAAGYTLGGTSRYGLNPAARDPLLLCRTEVVAWDTVADLELKVGGAWDWFQFRRPDPAK
jgi:peptidoglycan/xylan/chitin deacetylase (PgdA/CDA1 family)